MISASVAEAHRFGRVKRNGYDPVEVDAVVTRLVESLRTYETKTEALEERLAEADASADAIRRTFLAAEATRNEIVETAHTEAASTTDTAQQEAEGILGAARRSASDLIASAESDASAMAELADRLDHEIAQRRDEILTQAHDEAQAVMTEAEWAAAQQKLAAVEEASLIVDSATLEADELRSQALLSHGYTTLAAARLSSEARTAADAIIRDAHAEASNLVAAASQDSATLQHKAAALRVAVADLQRSAGELAALTAEEAAVLDLSQIEAMDALAVDADHGASDHMEHAVVEAAADDTADIRDEPRHIQQVDHIDLTEEEDSGPILSIADPEDVVDEEPEVELEPDPRTYYQRSTGIPLSERIKIARKSG